MPPVLAEGFYALIPACRTVCRTTTNSLWELSYALSYDKTSSLGVYQPLQGVSEVVKVEEEEQQAVLQAAGLRGQNLDIEPEFTSMDITE